MKKLIIAIALLLVAGCVPASQQEVLELTNRVNQIVPAVREAMSTSSEDTKEKIEIVLGQVEEINESVATAEDPVEAIEKGWKASEPFNPYYTHGLLILGLLKLFRDKKKSDNALEEVVIGIENSDKSDMLKASLNKSESKATKNMVSFIRNKVS